MSSLNHCQLMGSLHSILRSDEQSFSNSMVSTRLHPILKDVNSWQASRPFLFLSLRRLYFPKSGHWCAIGDLAIQFKIETDTVVKHIHDSDRMAIVFHKVTWNIHPSSLSLKIHLIQIDFALLHLVASSKWVNTSNKKN